MFKTFSNQIFNINTLILVIKYVRTKIITLEYQGWKKKNYLQNKINMTIFVFIRIKLLNAFFNKY